MPKKLNDADSCIWTFKMATQSNYKEAGIKSTSWTNTSLKKLNDANSCIWMIKMAAKPIQRGKGAPSEQCYKSNQQAKQARPKTKLNDITISSR